MRNGTTGNVLRSTRTGLAYRDEGRGPAILMIHGWGVSGALLEDLAARLADRFRVVVPDLPGHGESPPLTDDFHFGDFADALAEFIDETGLDGACLVGWSMGAMVCWDLLDRHPEIEAAGLVCIDMVPRLVNGASWTLGLRDGEGPEVFEVQIQRMLEDWTAYTGRFVPRIFASEPSDAVATTVAQTRRVALANDPDSMARAWGEMCAQDFRETLPRIAVPAWVVAGEKSQLYGPAAGRWVADTLPRAALSVYPRSGHAPHLEEPERFARDLAQFVQRINGASDIAEPKPNAVNENPA